MKNKYVIKSSLFLDDELVFYLHEMSKKGWKLDFMGYYYKFIPCHETYKYQIDYNEPSEEYLEILNEYGYEEVKCGFDFHVYASKNLHAPDLNTEESLIVASKLKRFPISKIVLCILAAVICYFIAKLGLKDIFIMGIGAYYYDPESFWMGIVFGIIMLLFGGLAIYNICARCLLKNGIGNLKILKTITIIKDILLIVGMSFSFVFALIDGDFFNIEFIELFVIIIIIEYFVKFCCRKLKSNISRKLVNFLEITCIVIVWILIFDHNGVDEKVDEKIVIDHFPVSDRITSKYNNHYTSVVEFEHNTHIKDITREPIYSQSRYVECKDSEIAKEVFRYIVIPADRECREIIDYQKFMEDEDRNQWSSDETDYRSYQQAISSFKKVNHYYICHQYVIILFNNKVIQIYIDDIDQINMILQEFIDFNL